MKGKFKKIIKGAIIILILMALILPLVFFTGSSSVKADTSIVSPSTATISSDSGLSCTDTAAWSNESYAMAQDDAVATIANNNLDSNNISRKLSLSNFGVNLPAGSVVDGIVVKIDKYKTQGSIVDAVVRLTKTAGTAVGDNKADTTTAWASSDTDTYKSYGGATDKWGTTWTEAEVESSGFGAVICVKAKSNNSRPAIDHVEITVYYTPPISVDLSGTAYQSEGGSALTSKTLKIYKNGSTFLASPSTDVSIGAWSATGLNISSGDIINVYIDNDTTYKGNTIFVSDGNDQTNIDVYGGVLVVRHDSGISITNANLSSGRVNGDTSDMMYSVSGSNLTATSSAEIHIWSGDTFAPEGKIITQGNAGHFHLDDNASSTLSTADNIVAGNIVIDSGATLNVNNDTRLSGNIINNGTFNHNNSTLEFINSLITTTITSTSDINFSTLKSNAAGKTIRFQKQIAGSPKFIIGQFNLQGILSNPIFITSDTSGIQWNVYFNSSQSNINYVRLIDSGCAAGTASVIGNITILDGGNNGVCWGIIERNTGSVPVGAEINHGGGSLKTGGNKGTPSSNSTIVEGGGTVQIGGSVAPPSTISP